MASMETVRPYVIECRRGPVHWIYRSDFSFGEWLETWLPVEEEFERVRADLQLLRPEWLIVWPEDQGQRWEDC